VAKGHDENLRAVTDAHRAVAYEQAQWIAIAVRDPKQMPKFKPLKRSGPSKIPKEIQTDLVRAFFMSKAGQYG